MATMFRVLICAIFANLTAAQVANSTSNAASATTSSLTVASSTSSATSSISSSVSSTSRAGSSSTTLPSVTSTTPSVAPSTSSVAPSTSVSIPSSSSSIIPASSTAPPSIVSTSSSTVIEPSTSSHSSASQTKTETYTYSSVSSSVSYQSTVYSTAAVIVTTQPDGQTSQLTEYTVVQTSVPATTLYSTTVVTSTESPTGVAGLQSNSLSSSSSSLSTGAKAGIGAGVGVAVVAAAIIGALYAMRRRRRHTAIADSDRYTPSLGPSMVGGYGGAIGKTVSHYTESETRGPYSPPIPESNPADRYAVPGVSPQRTPFPPNSRTSEASFNSGSESMPFRPGMTVVPGQTVYPRIEELPEQNNHQQSGYAAGYAGGTAGNPSHTHGGEETPSLYSDDGNNTNTSTHPVPSGVPRQASPAALELSADTVGHGYRGVDPEQPYHTRSQLTKPLTQQERYDVAHNF